MQLGFWIVTEPMSYDNEVQITISRKDNMQMYKNYKCFIFNSLPLLQR